MDLASRRLAGIGFAAAVPGVVYVVNGDRIKGTISLVGAMGFLLWGFWPDLRRRVIGAPPDLVCEPILLPAEEALGDLTIPELGAIGSRPDKPFAAMVRVSNQSGVDIANLAASLRYFSGSGWEPVWSREPGAAFLRGGTNVAALPAGASRLLLVAVGYPDLGWFRVSGPALSPVSRLFLPDGLKSGDLRTSYARVAFLAPELEIARGFRLGRVSGAGLTFSEIDS